jgi:hypothetical protein
MGALVVDRMKRFAEALDILRDSVIGRLVEDLLLVEAVVPALEACLALCPVPP